MQEDGSDDSERGRLERDVVGDLVDAVRRALLVGELRERAFTRQHEDQVVRVDAAQTGRVDKLGRPVDRGPFDVMDRD